MLLVGSCSSRLAIRSIRILLGSVAIVFGAVGLGYGSRADWIYSVEVPLDKTASSNVIGAATEALVGVLLRTTGLTQLPESAEIATALRTVERYYTRTSFVNHLAEDGSEMQQRHVVFEFDPPAIQELLRRAQLPIWTAVRPEIVVWLVVEEGDEARLASPILDLELTDSVRFRALQRGLPIQVPLGDILDLELGVPELARAKMWVAVEQGSKRYRGDTFAVIQFVTNTSDSTCQGGGVISLRSIVRKFEFDCAGKETWGVSAADGLADQVISWYAVPNKKTEMLRVDVEGIGTPRAYAEVLNYLRSWEVVYRVDVVKARGDVLSLHVESIASAPQLLRILSEHGTLKEVAQSNSVSSGEPLRLHWLGIR